MGLMAWGSNTWGAGRDSGGYDGRHGNRGSPNRDHIAFRDEPDWAQFHTLTGELTVSPSAWRVFGVAGSSVDV